jgi:general L-amino acid transport system substrate-binding protein
MPGWLNLLVGGVAIILTATPSASTTPPSPTLVEIEERGVLRCGVTDGSPGFADSGLRNAWTGFDVDVCRAIAAVIFNDPAKVTFVHLSISDRFDGLLTGKVDILARVSERALRSSIGGQIDMPARTVIDGQGFLVFKSKDVARLEDLHKPTICVLEHIETENRLTQYFTERRIPHLLCIASSYDDLQDAYEAGQCDAWSDDISSLAMERMMMVKPEQHVLLPEMISRDPSGPVIRRGDGTLAEIVRGTVAALGAVEANAAVSTPNPATSDVGSAKTQFERAVRHIGHLGEIFDKTLGANSPIKMPRSPAIAKQETG